MDKCRLDRRRVHLLLRYRRSFSDYLLASLDRWWRCARRRTRGWRDMLWRWEVDWMTSTLWVVVEDDRRRWNGGKGFNRHHDDRPWNWWFFEATAMYKNRRRRRGFEGPCPFDRDQPSVTSFWNLQERRRLVCLAECDWMKGWAMIPGGLTALAYADAASQRLEDAVGAVTKYDWHPLWCLAGGWSRLEEGELGRWAEKKASFRWAIWTPWFAEGAYADELEMFKGCCFLLTVTTSLNPVVLFLSFLLIFISTNFSLNRM